MSIATLAGITLLTLLSGVGFFFFAVTRGTLLVRSFLNRPTTATTHIYPVYSERWLINLVDFQPLISAILLFQYRNVVNRIVSEIRNTELEGKKVLISSCAFGNVIPRIVHESVGKNAEKVIITDIVVNELIRAENKLGIHKEKIELLKEDATCMKQKDSSVEVNVMFFLFHELPHHLKDKAIVEAGRVLAPGGKLILAEFHKPDSFLLRILSRAYFYIFEPYALALWDRYDPVRILEKEKKWKCERTTFFSGNFQVVIATKTGSGTF